ncbi:MAG: hypothetical protein AAGN15_15550 [Cyanobacteria bacterium J06581_3]
MSYPFSHESQPSRRSASDTPKASVNNSPSRLAIKPLLAGGLIVSLLGLLLDVNGVKTFLSNPAALARSPKITKSVEQLSSACTSEVVSTAQLSRQQLLELLAVPERDSKTRIREIVAEPYCQLSAINIRAGVAAEREAYPLAFDPNTTLVILYENDEYAGYRFKH